MTAKQELLARLRDMVKEEETAIPIYSRHLNNALFLSEFSETDRADIRMKLEVLIQESQQHQRLFEAMIRDIEEGDRDVY